jgi:hypothetical protein
MVSDTYAYLNGTDPEFWDEGDWIKCDRCGDSYDYKQYKSFTCYDCENGEE